METCLPILVAVPFLGFLVSLMMPAAREKFISATAFTTSGLSLLLSLGFTAHWVYRGAPVMNVKEMSIYAAHGYDFFIDFYFDRVSAVYLGVGALLTFLVATYSRYYLHRESGYKRFFNTMLFFHFGYNITVLSGNFETLFVGWEVLGLSSFLLIAFYRQRYLPVKNAIKVFTIYRLGDVGILMAMWLSHHLWHENITFLKLGNYELVHEHLQSHTIVGVAISLMLLTAAAAKSAQMPFTAWLPRAMEGPTPSSAIFYGSLSVHIGAFLLMRTFPFWEHQTTVRVMIGVLGVSTALVAGLVARVQSTVKSQIAYSSAAQIGLIFLEVAAGFETLALIHFAGNAFLRTYQLLISPSTVTYLIREQFYSFIPPSRAGRQDWLSRTRYSLYVLAMKEFNLDLLIFNVLLKPLKKVRSVLDFLTLRSLLVFFIPSYLLGFYLAYVNLPLSAATRDELSILVAFLAFLMVAKAYNERGSPRLAWSLVISGHLFVDLSIAFNDGFALADTVIYLSGVLLSGAVGLVCLEKVRLSQEHRPDLNQFEGMAHRYRRLAFVFLLSCLGMAGFPITTTFFGEDMILTHLHEGQVLPAFLIALTFIINGIALMRIYARIFLGPHKRSHARRPDLTA